MDAIVQILVASLLITLRAAASPPCDGRYEGRLRCANCTMTGRCVGGQVVEETPCGAGQACIEFRDTAFCTSIENTKCNCGGADVRCDPYDPRAQIQCLPDGGVLKGRQCGVHQVCSAGQCVLSDVFTSNPCGFNSSSALEYPSCTSGYECANGDIVRTHACRDGEYFDLEDLRCRPYLPYRCGDGVGFYPVVTDCRTGVFCAEGRVISRILCNEGDYFNPNTSDCQALVDLNLPCAAYSQCDFSLIEGMNSPLGTTSVIRDTTVLTTRNYRTSSTPSSLHTISHTLTSPFLTTTTPTTTTTTATAIPTTTTEPAPCDNGPEGTGVFQFLLNISRRVVTSMKFAWSGSGGNLPNLGGPGGYPAGNPGGYPAGNPGGHPGGYPAGNPVGNPVGNPGGNPGGNPDGSFGNFPGGYPGGFFGGHPGGFLGNFSGGYPGGYPGGYRQDAPEDEQNFH